MKQRDVPYGLLEPPEHSFWVIPLRHASGAVTKQEKILPSLSKFRAVIHDVHPEVSPGWPDINGATCSYDDAIPAVGSFGRLDEAMGWPEDADHMCSVSRF